MSAQFGDQTSDVCAALTLLNAVPGRLGIQVGLQVFVTEAVEGMLASQDRREQVTICLSDGIESGVTLPLMGFGMAQAFEFSDGFACWLSVCQGIQVTIICLSPDLSIAPKIGDAFTHGLPATTATLRSVHDAPDTKLMRLVDGGLEAQQVDGLVPLDGVALHAMFDAAAFGTFLAVGGDLTLEVAMWFAPQKTQHVFGAECAHGDFHKRGQQGCQSGTVTKENVGGVFRLGERPIIIAQSRFADGA